LIAAARVAAQGKVVSRRVVTTRVRRKAPVAHAGPCILRVPVPVALRAPAVVRPLALRVQGSAPAQVLVALVLAARAARVLLRLRVRLRVRREQRRSSVADVSNTRRPKKAQ